MTTLIVFLQIHFLALLVVAVVLWRNLRRTLKPIVVKNSYRLDGTYSRRRQLIEHQSLNHAGFSILSALVIIFAATVLCGLVIVGFFCSQIEWPGLEAPNPAFFSVTFDAAFVEFLNEWQWQLLTTYIVVAILLCPPYLLYAYQHALERYKAHANTRCFEYYRQDWWDDSQNEKCNQSPDLAVLKQHRKRHAAKI